MADDIALRLTTMIRAMQDAVLPALPADNALAAEQANLVLASLRLIAEQHGYAYARAMADLRDLHALVGDLRAGRGADGASADDSAEALEHAGQLLRDLPAQSELIAAGKRLRVIADRLIEEAGDARQVADRVLGYAARDIARGRAWIAAAGFDPAPDEVQPLASLLAAPDRPA